MTSPLAKGLFARAIGESGGALTPIPAFGPKPLRIGEEDGAKFAQTLGASSIAELRGKPAQEILQVAIKAPITYGFGVVDGYVVPDHPAKVFAQGKQHDVPLLVGWNVDEGTLFAARLVKWGPDLPSYVDRIRHNSKIRQTRCCNSIHLVRRLNKTRRPLQLCSAMRSFPTAAGPGRTEPLPLPPDQRIATTSAPQPPGAPELSVNPLTSWRVSQRGTLLCVERYSDQDWPWVAEDRGSPKP